MPWCLGLLKTAETFCFRKRCFPMVMDLNSGHDREKREVVIILTAQREENFSCQIDLMRPSVF